MPASILSAKEEAVLEEQYEIAPKARDFFRAAYNTPGKTASKDGESRIKVSSFLSKMAFYYEKIRNSIDYKEEHLLRKNAIERILRREIFIQGAKDQFSLVKIDGREKYEKTAKHLLVELIRASYIPNDFLPERKIAEIGDLIFKYIKLKNLYLQNSKDEGEKTHAISNFIISLLACDIEEKISFNEVQQASVKNLYELLAQKIELPENSPYAKDKNLQIYIAIARKFLKFDDLMVSFALFKYYMREWEKSDSESDDQIVYVALELSGIYAKIQKDLEFPLRNKINKITLRYSVSLWILTELITADPSGVFNKARASINDFHEEIKKACQKKYDDARSKLWRAAVRSILYIFITKSIFVLLLEVPAIKLFGEEINQTALAINVSFPAILLLFSVMMAPMPDDENTKKIVNLADELIFTGKRGGKITLPRAVKRGTILNIVFGGFYMATFLASFGAIIWGLNKIGFNWVSIVIFLFFLAFVSFFSIRIRKIINDLIVVDQHDGFLNFLSNFFYTPIIYVGKWLSDKFARVNVFVFIMDFIIEAPFKTFVEMADEWGKYVKERRDEL